MLTYTIIISKVITAVIVMLPFILIGDLIIFIKFGFNLAEMIIILLSSVVFPLVAESLGIIINIKYPKLDAENDTEIVKQSLSSMVSVLLGMIFIGITVYVLYKAVTAGIAIDMIIALGLLIYILIYAILYIYLQKKSVKDFNKIM